MKTKYAALAMLLIVAAVYLAFLIARPYEDDESLYITSGMAVVHGEFNPLVPTWIDHFSNPFQYVIGSPIAPVIYGLAYLGGKEAGMGIIAVRLLAALAVLVSVILAARIVEREGGNPLFPLVLAALSPSAILLASDAYMDSLALLFLMIGIYLFYKEKYAWASLFMGLASLTKFILFLPYGLFAAYSLISKKRRIFSGVALAMVCVFVIAYHRILPILLNFLLHSRLSLDAGDRLWLFLKTLLMQLPLCSIGCLFLLPKIAGEKYRRTAFLLIPFVSIWLFLIAFTDYTSVQRHLMYAELPACILLAKPLSRLKLKHLALPLIAFAVLGLFISYEQMRNYPSYNKLGSQLSQVDGRVLALNHNVFILSKGWNATATADSVYSFYYFSYDETPGSSLEDYEKGIGDGFFDYAIISSYPNPGYPKYQAIDAMVRKDYCLLYRSNSSDGLDIYKRC